jgi:hypothetical protein
MRLGLLGPAHGDQDALARAARFLLLEAGVSRAVYLGVDDALDVVVRRWAEELVGGDPDDAAIWTRAAKRCLQADPEQIDEFLRSERQRLALKAFECLPGDGTRTIEILNGKVVVMIHDKSHLDEDDILPASLLVFGKAQEPLFRQVGSRWFLSPGPLSNHGVMTLEDSEDGIHYRLFDRDCREVRHDLLASLRNARVRVSGAAPS